jgi:hypothetical protein
MIFFACEDELVGDGECDGEGVVNVGGTENGVPVKVAVVDGVIGHT